MAVQEPELAAVCKVAAQEAVATQLKQLTFSQDRIFKFAQQVVDVDTVIAVTLVVQCVLAAEDELTTELAQVLTKQIW